MTITRFSSAPRKGLPFTPEQISKTKHVPDDAWVDPGPISCEDLEKVERERKSKKEIISHWYGSKSLRNILPERWDKGYQDITVNRLESYETKTYKETAAYSELKIGLLYKSIILGYGVGPIQRIAPTKAFAKYIKQHCAAAERLKAISLRAYESFADKGDFHQWTSMSWPVYLCLASAKSSLDAMSAVVGALVLGRIPAPRERLPDMWEIWKTLCPAKKPMLPFGREFHRLYKSRWYQRLLLARNEVVHRGAFPKYHEKHGVSLKPDLGQFKDRPYGFYSDSNERLNPKSSIKLIHLDKIMVGFVSELEKWEDEVSSSLAKASCYKSYMDDGIIIKAHFNPNGPLVDYSIQEGMYRSESKEFVQIQTRRSQRKMRRRSPGTVAKSWTARAPTSFS